MAKKNKNAMIMVRFDKYVGTGSLEDWRRLCHDIGLVGDLETVTKCRKVLHKVYINIHDLLNTVDAGILPRRFRNFKS